MGPPVTRSSRAAPPWLFVCFSNSPERLQLPNFAHLSFFCFFFFTHHQSGRNFHCSFAFLMKAQRVVRESEEEEEQVGSKYAGKLWGFFFGFPPHVKARQLNVRVLLVQVCSSNGSRIRRAYRSCEFFGVTNKWAHHLHRQLKRCGLKSLFLFILTICQIHQHLLCLVVSNSTAVSSSIYVTAKLCCTA